MTIFSLDLNLWLRCTCRVRGISLWYKAPTMWLMMEQWHTTFLKFELYLLTVLQVLLPPCLCWDSWPQNFCEVADVKSCLYRTATCLWTNGRKKQSLAEVKLQQIMPVTQGWKPSWHAVSRIFLNHQGHSWSTLSRQWSGNPCPMKMLLTVLLWLTNSTLNFISQCSKHTQ